MKIIFRKKRRAHLIRCLRILYWFFRLPVPICLFTRSRVYLTIIGSKFYVVYFNLQKNLSKIIENQFSISN